MADHLFLYLQHCHNSEELAFSTLSEGIVYNSIRYCISVAYDTVCQSTRYRVSVALAYTAPCIRNIRYRIV